MSIQILGLRTTTYIDKKTGEKKERTSDQGFFANRWRVETIEEIFADPHKILAAIPEDERWNLYYTACYCTLNKRELAYQNIIPFDIDGIDVDKCEEYVEPICHVLGIDKNKTGVLYTGNGLQLIIRIPDEKIIKEDIFFEKYRLQYKAICDKINHSLEKLKLPGAADTAVFTKSRILRMPCTVNRKPNKPVRTGRILFPKILPQFFDLITVSGIAELDAVDAITANEFQKMKRVSGEHALLECDFLKFCKESPEKVNEPQWYAMLSIVGRFENGNQIAHDMSQKHRDYQHSNTEKKLEQSMAASGPRTCKNINSLWGNCKLCKHFEKIKSPIAIIDPNAIATESAGFWNYDEKGKRGAPNFNDLLKAFKRDTNYFVDTLREKVFGFDQTHYRNFTDIDIRAYVERVMTPKPNQKQRNEFAAKVFANELKPTIEVEKLFFESIKGKMNLKNGVLDIKTLVIEPHADKYGFRYVLPYDYVLDADCPEFKSFLKQVTLNREELEKTLIEFMGYCLYPEYDDHCFLWLTGEGRNGKSTYMELVASLCGEYNSASVFLSQFEEEKYLEMLNDKLVNISEESDGVKISGKVLGILKALSAGGRVMVDQKYEVPYAMRNQTKFILASNIEPFIGGGETALRSRMINIPFELKLEDHTTGVRTIRDGYREILKAELPGILNLALKSLHEFISRPQRKIFRGKISADTFNRMLRESDAFERWAQDTLEIRKNNEISLAVLHDAFMEEMGSDFKATREWFSKKLRKKFSIQCEVFRKRVGNDLPRYVRGVALIREEGLKF